MFMCIIPDTFRAKGMFTWNQIFNVQQITAEKNLGAFWLFFFFFQRELKYKFSSWFTLSITALLLKCLFLTGSIHSTHIRIRMFRLWKWLEVKSFLFQPCQLHRAAFFPLHGCCRAGAGLWCYLSLLLFHTVTAIIYGRHYRRHHRHRKCLISILLWAKICENCHRAGISKFKSVYIANQIRMTELPPTVW